MSTALSRPPIVTPIRGRPTWSATTMRTIGPGASSRNGTQIAAAPASTPASSRAVAALPATTSCHSTTTATGATAQILSPRDSPSRTPATTVARRLGTPSRGSSRTRQSSTTRVPSGSIIVLASAAAAGYQSA